MPQTEGLLDNPAEAWPLLALAPLEGQLDSHPEAPRSLPVGAEGSAVKGRQVFTHDDRLPEAVRRLGIESNVIEVTRRESSNVQLRISKDPVSRYIEDAMALAHTHDLPAPAARRVIPGLCRHALEAACMESVRRRRLARGERHTDVKQLLESSAKLATKVALALFDDPDRTKDVLPRLNKEAPASADPYRWCNEGTHEDQPGPTLERIRSTEKLAHWLRVQA